MTTLRRYKEFPKLEDLDPGIEPGWDFDVLVLQAEPETTTKGGIILADTTRDNEQGAATDWLIVGLSPTAFMSQDWERTGLPCPFAPGDVILSRRYPGGADITGNDGRIYKLIKDKDVLAKRIPGKLASVAQSKAA